MDIEEIKSLTEYYKNQAGGSYNYHDGAIYQQGSGSNFSYENKA
jgi:hypothetical protein